VEDAQRATWFQRNRKWAIPVGCLLLLMGGCLASLAVVGLKATKAMTAEYTDIASLPRQAANEARISQPVIDLLGQPIEAGQMRNAHYQRNNSDTHVDFELPISGPKGKGTLKARAFRTEAKGTKPPFMFKQLTFVSEGANAQTVELIRGEP
jgi:hypothetical protein